MRRRDAVHTALGNEQHARTGWHCPTTGWWAAEELDQPCFIGEGNLMPAVAGSPVTWAATTLGGIAKLFPNVEMDLWPDVA
jgi:hypothetical protein